VDWIGVVGGTWEGVDWIGVVGCTGEGVDWIGVDGGKTTVTVVQLPSFPLYLIISYSFSPFLT